MKISSLSPLTNKSYLPSFSSFPYFFPLIFSYYPFYCPFPLFILQSADRVDLPTQVLGDLERLLVPANMEILWGYPWLEWFWEFVVPHPTSASPSSSLPPSSVTLPPPSTPHTPTSPNPSTEIRANVYDRTHGLVLFIAQKMMLYGILLSSVSFPHLLPRKHKLNEFEFRRTKNANLDF